MKTLRDDLEAIVRMGSKAPSGDNLQPWYCDIVHNHIEVHARSVSTPHEFWHHRVGALIAQGAYIENLVIASRHFGYRVEVTLFPQGVPDTHIATLVLTKDNCPEDHLVRYLSERTTNRSHYTRRPLAEHEKEALLNVPTTLLGETARLVSVDDTKNIQKLAHAVSIQVEALFTHHDFHEGFYASQRLSVKDARVHNDGLDFRTLQLNPINRFFFTTVLSSWKSVRVLGFFGFPRFMAWMESFRYAHTASYVALIATSAPENDIQMLNTGRILERVWLTATSLTVALQPAFAVLLYEHFLSASQDSKIVNSTLYRKLTEAKKQIESIVGAKDGEEVLFLVRVGHARKRLRFFPFRKDPFAHE